jgi:Spy/CpxP family protein refolding chaperone
VSAWKVILATLVIYAAGVLTGALVVRNKPAPAPAPRPEVARMPGLLQNWFLERMTKELELTPEQQRILAKIISQSRERVQVLNSLVGPEIKEEMRALKDEIRAQLTPEQKQKFEDLCKPRPRAKKPDGANGTNGTQRSSK